MLYKLEYLWLDGNETPTIRSKTKIIEVLDELLLLDDCPEWSFDGSSTNQASGDNSDCILKPVRLFKDPLRSGFSYLVLCEVMTPDGNPHKTNNRAYLRKIDEKYKSHEYLYGFEQEYTLINPDNGRPLGFPDNSLTYPEPQGPYYCGIGTGKVIGRNLVEEHLNACLKCGLSIGGVNAEVMLGQWEYQIGPLSAIDVSDEITISRYLLNRIAENYNIIISLDPKPVEGDWNGSGCHINLSTNETRNTNGINIMKYICERLEENHDEHMSEYGLGNEKRMTGMHETSHINDFSWGESDRGCSIRIPISSVNNGCGYFEDRRPSANVEPYRASAILMKSIGRMLSSIVVE